MNTSVRFSSQKPARAWRVRLVAQCACASVCGRSGTPPLQRPPQCRHCLRRSAGGARAVAPTVAAAVQKTAIEADLPEYDDDRGHSAHHPGYRRRQLRFLFMKIFSQVASFVYFLALVPVLRWGPNKRRFPFSELLGGTEDAPEPPLLEGTWLRAALQFTTRDRLERATAFAGAPPPPPRRACFAYWCSALPARRPSRASWNRFADKGTSLLSARAITNRCSVRCRLLVPVPSRPPRRVQPRRSCRRCSPARACGGSCITTTLASSTRCVPSTTRWSSTSPTTASSSASCSPTRSSARASCKSTTASIGYDSAAARCESWAGCNSGVLPRSACRTGPARCRTALYKPQCRISLAAARKDVILGARRHVAALEGCSGGEVAMTGDATGAYLMRCGAPSFTTVCISVCHGLTGLPPPPPPCAFQFSSTLCLSGATRRRARPLLAGGWVLPLAVATYASCGQGRSWLASAAHEGAQAGGQAATASYLRAFFSFLVATRHFVFIPLGTSACPARCQRARCLPHHGRLRR